MTSYAKLIRSFLPKWDFFTSTGDEIRLEVKFGETASALGEWQNVLPPLKRLASHFLFNPKGNIAHAIQTHLSLCALQAGGITDKENNEKEICCRIAVHFLKEKKYSFSFYQTRLMVIKKDGLQELILWPIQSWPAQ